MFQLSPLVLQKSEDFTRQLLLNRVSLYFLNETQTEARCATNLRRALLKTFISALQVH